MSGWLLVLDQTAVIGRAAVVASGLKALPPEVEHLALRYPDLAQVVVRASHTTVVRGRARQQFPGLDRPSLWRAMAGAMATLDLGPEHILGRDVLESLMLGTPVLTPSTSGPTRAHAERSGAGLWYSEPGQRQDWSA